MAAMNWLLLAAAVVGCQCWKLPETDGRRSQHYTQQSDGAYKIGYNTADGAFQTGSRNHVSAPSGSSRDIVRHNSGVSGRYPSSNGALYWSTESTVQANRPSVYTFGMGLDSGNGQTYGARQATRPASLQELLTLPVPVGDTPEVAEAKKKFFQLYKAAAKAAEDAPDVSYSQQGRGHFSSRHRNTNNKGVSSISTPAYPFQNIPPTVGQDLNRAVHGFGYAHQSNNYRSRNNWPANANQQSSFSSTGYRQSGSTYTASDTEDQYVVPTPVQDTPEVAAAKLAFYKAYNAAAAAAEAAPDDDDGQWHYSSGNSNRRHTSGDFGLQQQREEYSSSGNFRARKEQHTFEQLSDDSYSRNSMMHQAKGSSSYQNGAQDKPYHQTQGSPNSPGVYSEYTASINHDPLASGDSLLKGRQTGISSGRQSSHSLTSSYRPKFDQSAQYNYASRGHGATQSTAYGSDESSTSGALDSYNLPHYATNRPDLSSYNLETSSVRSSGGSQNSGYQTYGSNLKSQNSRGYDSGGSQSGRSTFRDNGRISHQSLLPTRSPSVSNSGYNSQRAHNQRGYGRLSDFGAVTGKGNIISSDGPYHRQNVTVTYAD